jgi:hypothetical protein
MAGGTRAWWLFSGAVCATAAAAATTICEGITIARNRPTVANFM